MVRQSSTKVESSRQLEEDIKLDVRDGGYGLLTLIKFDWRTFERM